MEGGPDELYTLRAQFWLGHYGLAIQEAKQVARRPLSNALKLEREEFLMRAYTASHQYDKVDSGDTTALQAIALKAQYEAAAGKATQQEAILDRLKSLASSGDPGSTAQLIAAQTCLAAGQTKEAYGFVQNWNTLEAMATKLQILLKIDRLDLAKQQLEMMRSKFDEDSVLALLSSVYVHLATGSSVTGEAEHTINGLAEQYGPSVFLLNLLAAALAMQGDYAAAETKLQEALRDFAEIQPQHDTLVNLIAVYHQLNQTAQANAMLQQLSNENRTSPTQVSTTFCSSLERVNAAFDREATKYKV